MKKLLGLLICAMLLISVMSVAVMAKNDKQDKPDKEEKGIFGRIVSALARLFRGRAAEQGEESGEGIEATASAVQEPLEGEEQGPEAGPVPQLVECPEGTNAEFLEEVTVLPDGNFVSSENMLEEETIYLLEASGTYVYWEAQLPDAGIADAKYSLRPPGSHNPSNESAWISGDELPEPYTNFLELWVNNASVAWGEFNPEHVYAILFDGEGSEVDFVIYDSNYADNSGNLSVDIYECAVVGVQDSDGDGIPDNEDLCPDTVADEPEVRLGTNRWIWNGLEWETNKGNPNVQFTMQDTKGCSCFQILKMLPGQKQGHYKFGCSIGLMREFIASH